MANCKNCVSEKVCRYNDGHNLYCKEDYVCPHFRSTADVREVVKCENCKYYRKAEYFKNLTYCVRFSRKNGGFIGCVKCKPDDFCRYGERKEEVKK